MKISQITQWRKERIADTRLSSSTFLAKGIGLWLDNRNNPSLKNEIIERLILEKAELGYSTIYLASTRGACFFSTDPQGDTLNSVSSSAIVEAAKSGQITFTDFHYCSLHKKIHYDIIAPVLDSNNNPIAALLYRIDPDDYLYPLIKSWPTPSKTSETLLIRKDGDSVLFLNDLLRQTNTALKLRIPLTRKDVPAVQAVLGFKGIFEGKDYLNVDVLAYVEPVPGTPWFMVAKVDKSELYAELQFRSVFISLFTLMLILLTAVSLVLFYNSRQKNIYRKLLAADKELRESEAKFRNLFDHSPIGKSITGIDGSIQVNTAFCEMLGYTEEGLKSKKWQEISHPDDIQLSADTIQSLLDGKSSSARFEKRYLHKNGSIVWTDVASYLQRDEKGEPQFFITAVNDITVRKQLEFSMQTAQEETRRLLKAAERSRKVLLSVVEDEKLARETIRNLNQNLEQKVIERTSQLEAANKELEAFSYSVSHDLRAPLRHINGFIDLLTNQFPDSLPEKGMDYLSIIKDSASQMGMLIDDLLQFSRTGRQELRKSSIDMNLIFEDVLKTTVRHIEDRKIEWITNTLPTVYCDQSLIKQVWVNLLSNAVKFTQKKDKTVIEVGYEENEKDFVFSVRDNGVGFDMKYAHKLFGVFQRLHSKAEYDGTGIGLAHVQRIIHRHGGRVWADAELDRGAIFYFTLPK